MAPRVEESRWDLIALAVFAGEDDIVNREINILRQMDLREVRDYKRLWNEVRDYKRLITIYFYPQIRKRSNKTFVRVCAFYFIDGFIIF